MLRGSSSGVKHYCNAVDNDDDDDEVHPTKYSKLTTKSVDSETQRRTPSLLILCFQNIRTMLINHLRTKAYNRLSFPGSHNHTRM